MTSSFEGSSQGPSRAFSGRGICHFSRRDIGNVGLKNTGNGMRYTHDTENFLIFLFGRREKYELIACSRDKKFWRDLMKQKYHSSQDIGNQNPLGRPYHILVQFSRELLHCHCFSKKVLEIPCF